MAAKKNAAGARIFGGVEDAVAESAFTKLLMVQQCVPDLARIAAAVIRAFRKGKRLYLFGNGGSAADAQHIACELEGRFRKNRAALPALALTTNTSTLTSVSNDYDFRVAFSRQVEAHVRRGDVVLAISTSGESANVLEGVRAAKKAGALAIGFAGQKGGRLARAVDLCFCAPSTQTQRIQECHITAGHALCDAVERALFP